MQTKLSQGSALIFAMILSVIIIGFAGSAITLAHYNTKYNQQQGYNLQARYTAEAGLARAVQYVNSNFSQNKLSYSVVDALGNTQLWDGQPQPITVTRDGKTMTLGEYTVTMKTLTSADITVPSGVDITGDSSNSCRYISAVSTGYCPSKAHAKAQMTITATYKIQTEVSHVFDYSYFINNWGWLYGSTILSEGNVRSNGTFTLRSSPTIRSKARFESSNGSDLIGYIDDNGDGKQNNQDGGIYAWDQIDGTPSNKQGSAELYEGNRGVNNKPSVPQLPMPNLNNLSFYEGTAKKEGSSIQYYDSKTNKTKTINGVWGDESGETQNLYLEGTYENPIVINGTNVVRGNLIIRGWVTGQGVIYSGRNVYLPQRVLYKNSTSNRTPSTNSEASRENWREKNKDCDMLGLFARENIVMADFTNSTWQSNVNSYRTDANNKSAEDAGLDKIPNTGDAGEGDGKFTIEKDSNSNPIPGTGEDIDGDGQYDSTTPMSAFNLTDATNSPNTFTSNSSDWGGNIPTGITKYSDISYWDDANDNPDVYSKTKNNISQNFPQVDGFLYTNHFLAGWFTNNSYNYKDGNPRNNHRNNTKKVEFFGSLISRNESLIFSASGLTLAHDERLTAEDGSKYGFIMPRVWQPLKLVSITMQ